MSIEKAREALAKVQVVVLRDGDRTFYRVGPAVHAVTYSCIMVGQLMVFDGNSEPVELQPTVNDRGAWMVADGKPTQIMIQAKGRQETIGYRLRDPEMASAKYPVELSVEAGRELFDDCDYDEVPRSLYEDIYSDPEIVELTVSTNQFIVLDGTPKPADALPWVVNLRDELARRTELHHLFPGHIPGFRKAVADALNRSGRLRSGDLFSADRARVDEQRVRVKRWADFVPRSTRLVDDYDIRGRKKKAKREVTEGRYLEASLRLPDVIEGGTLAEATEKWNAALSEAVAELLGAVEGAPCLRCRGTGVVGESTQRIEVDDATVDVFLEQAGINRVPGAKPNRDVLRQALAAALEVQVARTGGGRG